MNGETILSLEALVKKAEAEAAETEKYRMQQLDEWIVDRGSNRDGY